MFLALRATGEEGYLPFVDGGRVGTGETIEGQTEAGRGRLYTLYPSTRDDNGMAVIAMLDRYIKTACVMLHVIYQCETRHGQANVSDELGESGNQICVRSCEARRPCPSACRLSRYRLPRACLHTRRRSK